jgi:hypothetical protein
MTRLRVKHAFATLACALMWVATPSIAQSSVDELSDFVLPAGEVSTADSLSVVYADLCGRPHPSGEKTPVVTRNGADVTVDFYLVDQRAVELCIAQVDQRPILIPASVGRLEKGTHNITRRLFVRNFDGEAYELVETQVDTVQVGDTPHAAVSGWWADPTRSGWGVSVSLLPPADGESAGRASLYLATHDPNGTQRWLIGDGRFEDATLTVSLYDKPGGAVQGTAVFTYTGCGEARLRVTGVNVRASSEDVVLRQLTRVAHVPACTLSPHAF